MSVLFPKVLGNEFLEPISCRWSLSLPPENIRKPGLLKFSGGIERD